MKNKDKLFDSDTTSESETSESESTSNSDSESDSDSQKNAKTSGNSKKENKEELSYAFEKGKLTIISQDLEEIPITIIRQFALKTTELNLSHNELNKLDGLEQFTSLKSLVLDNNQISSNTSFPKIRSLETFWINRNQIDNLEKFISAMKISYPNITYLSMLGNPACPNFFTGKDYDDYKRYRIFRLKSFVEETGKKYYRCMTPNCGATLIRFNNQYRFKSFWEFINQMASELGKTSMEIYQLAVERINSEIGEDDHFEIPPAHHVFADYFNN
ncbi:leucine-rich melanocyte differentiation-associated protein [Anaeramoeba ignava]|uniref:Leucine-rich melanocyte differentiation-associated protein n=1 Tax=Anaeramoeba ignava TaxID=1746090 RepID=A0A9Q0RGP7_ANAIG|nr:leucine-rich melanocyte differentiation-associated protein [Anaeramoeba ignava]